MLDLVLDPSCSSSQSAVGADLVDAVTLLAPLEPVPWQHEGANEHAAGDCDDGGEWQNVVEAEIREVVLKSAVEHGFEMWV